MRGFISKEFFLGGSQRFGWNREDSDFDFFFPPDAHESLINLNLPIAAASRYYVRDFTHYEGIVFNSHIDFIVARSSSSYDRLKKEHDKIADYLERHPLIVRQARSTRQRGKELYQWILSMTEDVKLV